MRTRQPWSYLPILIVFLFISAIAACGDDDSDTPDAPLQCTYDGVTYEIGETVPSEDCNTCTCSEPESGGTEGLIACTTIACACAPDDCGPALGMPNYLCDDGETMAGPGDCEMQDSGSCGWTVIECPEAPYDACEEKVCGEECSPCDPEVGDCPAATVVWFCDASGVCVDNDVTCDEDLCADVVCEGADAVCEGDTLMGGYTSSCDAATGECQSSPAEPPVECEFGCADGACLPEPGDAYDPCADKACGETCSICDPTDNDCMETAEVKGCNHSGVCEGGFDASLCAYEPCEAGDSFPASDGCNTCFCPAEGYTMETDCTEEECGEACKSSAECDESSFCDFEGDTCGVWGQTGNCVEKPMSCVAGGPGACGCDGNWATNSCELQAKGTDHMQFGGCTGIDPVALFACGDTECQIESEFCMISANDVAGPDQPEFYSSCGTLPDGCASGDCSCMEVQELEACYDGTGFTMMFYPGG